MLNLLGHLQCLCVHASFIQALGVIQLIRINIWVQLGELVIHVC